MSSFLIFTGAIAVLFARKAFGENYFFFLLACTTVVNMLPNAWKTVRSLYYSYLYVSARKWGWWLLCFVNIPLYPLNLLIDIFAKKRDWCYRFIYEQARKIEETPTEGGCASPVEEGWASGWSPAVRTFPLRRVENGNGDGKSGFRLSDLKLRNR